MAGIAEDEIVEHTLTQIQECYLFELPPRVRAQGWLAADMTKQMWTGRMRVVQRGKEAAIMLIDRRDGKLFAMCKVGDGAVERVPDSSRYFVIKIQNAQGRHAFVGLAFDDRNQAFDFNVALQEFKKDMERSTMLEKGGSAGGEGEVGGEGEADSGAPKVDLSLKQGEKIKISIGGGSKRASSRPKRSGRTGGGGGLALAPPPGDTARKAGGGIGLLAPPPGDTRRARGVSKPSSPLNSPPPAPAPAAVAAPSIGLMTLSHSSSSGYSGGSNSGSSPPVSGGGGGGGDGGLLGMMSSGTAGNGSSAAGTSNNGTNAYSAQQPQQQQQQQQQQEDDDPFGLGLGLASSSTTTPPQASSFSSPPPAAGGWGGGLSDMSGLGAGLPPASGGMGLGSMPSQQQPQQQSGAPTSMGYPSTDPFAQQPQQGFPSTATPPAGGGQQSAPVNDLLDGLF